MLFDSELRAAAERSKTYWLLSDLLMDQPSQETLRELAAALAAAARDDDPFAVDRLGQLKAAVDSALASPHGVVDLQVEFTRLLRGVDRSRGPIEPYESMVREGRLFGDTTEAVAAAYREAGLDEIAPEAGPPDHIATELRFLALLCFREMEGWQAGAAEAAKAWRDRQRHFIGQHLSQWLPQQCRALQQASSGPFYRVLAAIVEDTCARDQRYLAPETP